jgi:glycosyltransferase involved in cell wall biosynthesis
MITRSAWALHQAANADESQADKPSTRGLRRVLMIAYHFPPVRGSSGIQRTVRFARWLPELGWEPIILTAHPRAYEATVEDAANEVQPGMVVCRAFALDAARHLSIAGRYPDWLALPDRWSSWWLGAVPAGLSLIRRLRPDAIWSTHPLATAHRIGATLHRLTGLPWVADFRDPMAQDGYPKDARRWRSFKRIEERVFRDADVCVFTTQGAAATYRARYPDAAERIAVIENGYDEEVFANLPATVRRPLSPDRPLLLLHSGTMYPDERDPSTLFRALRRLVDSGRIRPGQLVLRFRASGHDGNLLARAAEAQVSEFVEVSPPAGYREALAEMMTADGLFVVQSADCNDQIPAKLYEYLRAQRPILGLADPRGDTARLLREAGQTHIGALESESAIAAALEGFLVSLRQGAALRPHATVIARASRRERTAELAACLNRVCARGRRPRREGFVPKTASITRAVVHRSFSDAVRAVPALGMLPAHAEFFCTLPWFEHLAYALGLKAEQQRLVVLDDAASGAALCLPLQVQDVQRRWGRERRLDSVANYYTGVYGPVVSAPDVINETSIFQAFECMGPELSACDVADLRPVAPGSPFFAAAQAAFRRLGFWVDSYFCFGNWYLPVAGRRFDDYYASVPSKVRNTIRRAENRLAKHPGARVEIVTPTSADLDSAIAHYTAVYAKSWKIPEPYALFIPGFCRLAAAQGWLRLGLLTLDDQPLAAQIWIVKDGKASIFKLAYDGEYAKFSPGSILTKALLRHVIDIDRVTEVDYLAGDDDYKKDWMSHRRERRGIIAFNRRTLRGRLNAAHHFGGRLLTAAFGK